MNKKTESMPEERSSAPPFEHAPPRKRYESPRLQEWGSILELTGGPLSDITDVDNGGSTGV